MTRTLIILLVATLGFGADTDKGRKGNNQYHDKKYEEAASLFREGMAESDESTDARVRSGLSNNLGCALNRLESYEEAAAAFAQAVELAPSEAELSRSAYNGGNTAFQAQDPQKSLSYYRQALLADPTNADARFNYEFVRRMMDQQQESGGEGDPQQNQEQQEQDDQEKQDQEQQEDEEQQDEQGDNSEQEQQEEQEQPPQPEPQDQESEMSEEQAEQILQALQNDEEELMRQVWRMKGKPRNVDKDW